MKTLICKQPGELAYGLAAMPTPKPGHAIVKIRKVGICGTDLHAFEGTQPYFSYPRILGHELTAEIVASTHFERGDLVAVIPYIHCGICVACKADKTNCCERIAVLGVHKDGGMSEYLSVPEDLLILGDGLNAEQLALVEPLSIGAHGIRRAKVEAGEFVLVIGAGPIGLAAMEMARIAGANVIATDVDQQRLTFAKEVLGFPHTIQAGEDLPKAIRNITSGELPTVVIDATGNQQAINNGLNYLAHGGRYVLIGLQKELLQFPHPEFHKKETTLMSSRNATRADFELVMHCIRSGLMKPELLITHRVKFGEVKSEFAKWLGKDSGVVKVMVDMG